MDPVTAAGIGLSVTSLAFQLFSGCINGYQLLLDVADMPKKFEHVRVRMRLEQARLLNWGDKVGLLEDLLEEPGLVLHLHRNLIFDILLEISRLFKACLKVDTKFAAFTPTKSSSVRPSGSLMLEGTNTTSRRTETLLAKAMNVVRKSGELPKRLEWAMVQQDRFEILVKQLISYNNSIVSLLDGASLQQIRHTQMQSQLTLLHLSTKIDDLRRLTQAMQIKPTRDDPTTILHQARIDSAVRLGKNNSNASFENLDLARLANFKADRLSIEQDVPGIKDKLISGTEVRVVRRSSGIETARYHEQNVWIEWKEFDQANPNPFWQSLVEARVKQLASLLSVPDMPPEFRAPRCLGYFEEVDDDSTVQYGFVNEFPKNATESATPRTLLDLIKYGEMPSLTKRVRLAVALASSLMYLHSVNWLHKGIRSENVIFFAQNEATIDYTVLILAGFEYARPDLPEEVTEKPRSILQHDIYRHPSSLTTPKARSQKSWDIYSLGVVLTEIALWKSIGDISGIDFNQSTAKSKVRRVRALLLQDQFLDKIGAQCGDRYREAVKCCISDRPDLGPQIEGAELDPNASLDLTEVFSQDVLDMLQSIQL